MQRGWVGVDLYNIWCKQALYVSWKQMHTNLMPTLPPSLLVSYTFPHSPYPPPFFEPKSTYLQGCRWKWVEREGEKSVCAGTCGCGCEAGVGVFVRPACEAGVGAFVSAESGQNSAKSKGKAWVLLNFSEEPKWGPSFVFPFLFSSVLRRIFDPMIIRRWWVADPLIRWWAVIYEISLRRLTLIGVRLLAHCKHY